MINPDFFIDFNCENCGHPNRKKIEIKPKDADLPGLLYSVTPKKLDKRFQKPPHDHDHEHALFEERKKIHEHDHDHEQALDELGLTPAQRDLLEQLEKLTEREGRSAKFRKMWIDRIREHPNEVFRAISDCRVMIRENQIKKTIGGTLNWLFDLFTGRRKIA